MNSCGLSALLLMSHVVFTPFASSCEVRYLSVLAAVLETAQMQGYLHLLVIAGVIEIREKVSKEVP